MDRSVPTKPFPIISALVSLGIWLIWKRLRSRRLRQPTVTCVEPAEYFVYPAISPDTGFDINTTPAVPYRPFKWGPTYAITMGIRNMDFDNWIELDSRFPAYHRIRAHRMKTRGAESYRILEDTAFAPSGELAAKELVHELSEFLSRKYPKIYQVRRKKPCARDLGWYGEGEIYSIDIIPLKATYNLDVDDPMMVSGLLIQDDIAVMLEGVDGRYYFQAGAVCTAGFWRMKDKIGLPLEEIHLSGHVPRYREKLQTSLNRFFQKMKVDRPVLRNNFFFQIVEDVPPGSKVEKLDAEELTWSTTTNGPEDFWDHGNQRPDVTVKDLSVKNIRFRTERQSLRRLPRSGAVVFTVRTYIEPVVDIVKEAGVPGRLASSINSMGEDVLRYKGAHLWKDTLLPFLEEQHQAQLATGVITDSEPEHKYPY